MKRQNASIVIPACLSVAVHATLLTVLPRYFSSRSGNSGTDNVPVAKLAQLPDPPPELPLPEPQIGDRAGTGYATHQVDAPNEATAREADADQAYLGLDPPGVDRSGRGRGQAEVLGNDGSGGSSGGSTPQQPARAVAPFGMSAELKLPRSAQADAPRQANAVADADAGGALIGFSTTPIDQMREALPQPALVAPATQPSTAVEVALAQQPKPASADSQSTGGSAHGEPLPTGSPARMSDSESDPFSRLGNVTFTDGAMKIQFGRKVKTRRPKILLAGQIGRLMLQHPDVVLNIDVDATGKVTQVSVDKSSGSNDIDQPTRVAVYDWWFEPPTDAKGNPLPSRLKFTIGFR
jgi:TonB family protein